MLASIIVFTTTYALILPAITLDQDTAANEPGIEFPDDQSEGQLLEDEDPTDIIVQDVPETERVINETECISDQDGDITEESDAETEPDTAGETETETETTAPSTTGMPAAVFREETNKDHKDNVIVTVTAEEGTFPAGSFMTVRNVTDIDNKVETSVKDAVDKSDKADGEIKAMQVIDISFFNEDGQKIEPLKEIKVKFESESIKKIEEPVLVHIPDEGKGDAKVVEQISEQEAEQEGKKDSEIIFKADDFSMYVIVETESITVTYLTADGNTYEVTVTCDSEAGIPEGSELIVSELTEEDEDYDSYVSQTADKVNLAVSELSFIRLFDIKIVDEDGDKVTLGAPVDVQIRLLDKEEIEQSAQVVHFGDDIEIMDSTVEGDTVSFATTGFSAYAIVEGPSASGGDWGWQKVVDLDEFLEFASSGLIVGHSDGFYFTDETYRVNNTSRTGIKKTEKPGQAFPRDSAKLYYFEEDPDNTGRYYAYCIKNGVNWYVKQSTNSLTLVSSKSDATSFMITNESDTVFTVENGGYYWNEQGDAAGNGFAAYNQNNKGSKINFWHYVDIEDEPYGLENKTYGFMNWNGGVAGKALMAEGALDAKALIVMSTADNSDQLFVPNTSDISMWTFHWVSGDRYRITTVVDGSTKYLRIAADGLSVVSEPDDNCNIQVIPGTGIHAGEISLKTDDATLTFSGTVEGGFSVNGAAGNEWLHFVELSELTDEYFLTYSAGKVSVSDEAITNGSQVIVYTRSWNEEKKQYDLYAISSDGTLVPVFDTGDSIEWVSGQINKLLWNFTEYYWEGTDDPNFYYELYNQYSEKFVAPQVTDSQILADDPIGINLNGRRDGKYYSSILAWDDENYSYVGLKVENGHIVSCPKSEAMDFYFAIMEDMNVDDDLSTVQTIDHEQYGIIMKIIDLENGKNHDGYMSQYLGSSAGGIGNVLQQGLLSTDLGSDGYPVAHLGSLAGLYSGARKVNKLFIESTYYSSGYFMYDSTQNFAHLNDDNTFTVYKELGTYDSGSGRPTLKHGQFFPFNDLKAGLFCGTNGKNLYGLDTSHELPDSDPRKYENLYNIEHDGVSTDYYFAVELEASFTQTPNGLDAWGHDIIFEFTGDDDFWLYVDGELVIDLGGIHSAVPGSVNFRTGVVNVNGTNTTLRELFESNFRKRNPGATDADVATHLAEYFDEGSTVFRDYTNHTMRIFYMERGAGASNLQMRFNLAAVKEGNVQLSKKLSGVDSFEDVLAEFPYQIKYKDENGVEHNLQNAIPHSPTQNTDYVYYKDTINPVDYEPEITIDGVTYEDVFFLKPGEIADISFPEGMVSYRIIECGVNTDVYSKVTVNDTEIEGTPVTGTANRKDYGIGYDTTANRAKVNYVNEVNPDALKTLTIEKHLLREDGETRIPYSEDQTPFGFRLYLASEYDELSDANMHTYHVKDSDDNYCRWNKESKVFESLGKTNFADLTDAEKEAASFTTSIYGSISKIPADHTVEIRNVIAGTKFKVVERPQDMPDGYSFQRYEYNNDPSQTVPAEAGVSDVVRSDKADPAIKVRNIKGWGLRVNKVWTDSEYMADRAAAYFAVYTKPGDQETLVLDSVRQLSFDESEQTVYWYYKTLPVSGVDFEDYVIREVTLTGSITVDDDGVVSGYSSITPIAEGGELKIQGRQKGEDQSSEFKYNVSYEQGIITEGANVRVDTVTNDRPGIVLKKMQWDGHTPLAGAVFELKDNEDNLIGTFTSDDAGLITVAFLRDNVPYTLTETTAPHTWHGLQHPLTIVLNEGDVDVSGEDTGYYQVTPGDGVIPTLTVKDRPFELHAVKKDGDTDLPMEGVTFALHKQVSVGGVINIDVNPMPGYEALVTDANGLIPQIDNTLPAGIYEIREKQTPSGYEPIGYIQFKITETGDITFVNQTPTGVTLDKNEEGTAIQYVLTIPNHRLTDVTLKKVDNSSHSLKGSKFTLYKFESSWKSIEDIDMTNLTEKVLANLEVGRYRLTETKSPDGYIILSKDIYFNIEPGDGGTIQVRLTDEAGTGGNSNENASLSGTVITVKNTPGEELPKTGGPGRTLYILGGSALLMASALIYGFRLRRRRKLYKGQRL